MTAQRQASLFDTPTVRAPTAAAPAAPTNAPRPTGWRAPTHPREHVCRTCQGAASCGVGEAWFCVACAPADFWPAGRTS